MTTTNVKLTSSEISLLWNDRHSNDLTTTMLSQFLQHVENPVIEQLLQAAKSNCDNQLTKLTHLYKAEGLRVSESLQAELHDHTSKLYSDQFYLFYLNNIARFSMQTYSLALSNAYRQDIRQLMRQALDKSIELHEQVVAVMAETGALVRPPAIESPASISYVQKENLTDLWTSDKRPMTALEISNFFCNIQNNVLGRSLLIGFSQVAQDTEIRDYFIKGRDIAEKHLKIFRAFLDDHHLPTPETWDCEATSSTKPPFTDKLMMTHILYLSATSISNYGLAISSEARKDTITAYTRLAAEVMKFAQEGTKLMIKRNWYEQPPVGPDRNRFAKR